MSSARFGGGVAGGKTLTVIGVDYGTEASTAAVMRRNEDGSWTLLELVEGKGLDEVWRARHDSNVRPPD